MKSKFITIEGLDGSGKTTVTYRITKYLNNNYGITDLITTHEPGGTPIADILRVLIKYSWVTDEVISDISELLMVYAARFQLIENVIKPALSKGYWVIGDRYDLSSQAYQGSRRNIDISLLNTLSGKVSSILEPNLTLYLDISPELSMSRIKNKRMLDRIEQEPLSFFTHIRSCYKKLAAVNKNIIIVDASQSLEEVSTVIFKHLDQWLLRNQE